MFVLISLIVLSLSLPQISVSPSSIATVSSFQFDQVNGIGIQVRYDRFSMGYYRVTLTTRSQGELIKVGDGWVYQKEVSLWEANAVAFKNEIVDIGIGLNKIYNGSIGWQVFIEKNFGGVVSARVGFRRIGLTSPIDSITATFSVNIIEAVKSYRSQVSSFARNSRN